MNFTKNKWEAVKETKVVPILEIKSEERDEHISLMRKIFEVQSSSGKCGEMNDFIQDYISSLNDDNILVEQDGVGNIYVTKGVATTYPCIVSHTDTVHDIIPKEDYMVIDNNKHFFAINKSKMDLTGIGGDDKCGIYTCLDNLIREPKIKLAFFVDEEIGCVGSSQADLSFFNDVSFILQADRKGYNDIVSNISGIEMFDADFLFKIDDTLNLYHRELNNGGMTDVMQLAEDGVQVSMANFSCGYYNPHSDSEYVVIDELILTSILFRDIIKDAYIDGERNEFKREIRTYNYGYDDMWSGYSYNGYGNVTKSRDIHHHNHDECKKCGCETTLDVDAKMYFCNNCLDYDYDKGVLDGIGIDSSNDKNVPF